MIESLKALFGGRKAPEEKGDASETAISIAALLVEAALADEDYAEREKALIARLLVSEFGVRESDAPSVLAEAERRQAEAVDLFRFSREVKSLPHDEKVRLIECLWRVALCDGDKDTWEDMLVRRVASLIHVEDVESGLARQRVQKELGR